MPGMFFVFVLIFLLDGCDVVSPNASYRSSVATCLVSPSVPAFACVRKHLTPIPVQIRGPNASACTTFPVPRGELQSKLQLVADLLHWTSTWHYDRVEAKHKHHRTAQAWSPSRICHFFTESRPQAVRSTPGSQNCCAWVIRAVVSPLSWL